MIKSFDNKILHSTVVRYLIAGGLSYVFELSTIYLLILAFGVDDVIAVAIAFWVGFLLAFLLQKLFTFSNRNSNKSIMLKQTILYSLLVSFNYIFTVSLVYLFIDFEVGLTRTIALIATTLWNYFIYKLILFK